MAVKKFYLDSGNADIKWLDAGKNYGFFPHAFARLTDAQWRRVTDRNAHIPRGYALINGTGYAIGKHAQRYITEHLRTGARRYQSDYYGIGLAYAMSQAYTGRSHTIQLHASYAPQDIDYVAHLKASATGEWRVESVNGEQRFTVRDVYALDEPLGGFHHLVLNNNGTENKRAGLSDFTVSVVDVGGHTVDTVIIDDGLDIDLSSIQSSRVGTLSLFKQFTDDLRANNRKAFMDSGDLNQNFVFNALISGVYSFGNIDIACHHEANEAKNALAETVYDTIISTSGGIANLNAILLTGGGSVLIENELRRIFGNAINLIMVEEDRNLMRYANVFGMRKAFLLLERA